MDGVIQTDPLPKEAIDLIRCGLGNGSRAFVLHGVAGGGKSAMIEQVAAIMELPLSVLGRCTHGGGGYACLTSDNYALELYLDSEQRKALASLERPTVLSVAAHDAGLQKVLADALRPGGSGALSVLELDGQTPAQPLKISPFAVAFFEVRGDGPEDSDCLEFAALADTTPLTYAGLDERQQLALVASEPSPGVAWADPEPRTYLLDGPNQVDYEDPLAIEVRRAVADSEADQPLRARLIGELVDALGKVEPSVKSPVGYAFVERALAVGEYQAYAGDQRADRTLRLQFDTLFSAEQHQYRAIQNQIMADVLVPLQNYTERLYNAGAAARAAGLSAASA